LLGDGTVIRCSAEGDLANWRRISMARKHGSGSCAPEDSLVSIFSQVEDPRIERTKAHSLETILFIALTAVICGADTFVGMAHFGSKKREWLSNYVDVSNGTPSHDTFGRVFAALKTSALSEAFASWTSAVAGKVQGVVAVDGKTLRRSFRDGTKKSFVHMVSAWSATNRLVLGQVKTEEKSNEITAIPRLLELLDINGCLVTIDAMGCQRDIAAKIVEGGGDYLLAVKGNQDALYTELKDIFSTALADDEIANELDTHHAPETGHGRKEVRTCRVVDIRGLLNCEENWKGVATAVMVSATRIVSSQETTEVRYYISSSKFLASKQALEAARSHWGIENQCHWILDVAFDEDSSRARVGNAGANFAVVRHMALNLLSREKSTKVGIKNRRLIAAWDEDYLTKVIASMS
jgi:predicted transposase YbfD/YdcC